MWMEILKKEIFEENPGNLFVDGNSKERKVLKKTWAIYLWMEILKKEFFEENLGNIFARTRWSHHICRRKASDNIFPT